MLEEIAEEFDEVPQIEDLPEDDDTLSTLQRDFREKYGTSRQESRRPSFMQMKSDANLFSMYLTNALQAAKSRQNNFDHDRWDSVSNYSEAQS